MNSEWTVLRRLYDSDIVAMMTNDPRDNLMCRCGHAGREHVKHYGRVRGSTIELCLVAGCPCIAFQPQPEVKAAP